MGAAAASGELSASDLSAFWVIADHVNSQSGLSWPSLKTIAAKAGISERAAPRAVKDLRSKGYVTVAQQGTRTRSTRYRLTLKGVASAKAESTPGTDNVDSTHSTGGVLTGLSGGTDRTGSDVLTELSAYPSYDPAHKAGEEGGDAGFGTGAGAPALAASAAKSGSSAHDRFWKAYPKKERAVSAEQELDAHLAAGADIEAIIRGAEDYRRLCEHKHRERTYIAAPLNWLKERRWEEDFSIPLPKPPKTSKKSPSAKGKSGSLKKAAKSRQRQEIPTEREARLAKRRQKTAERMEQARKDAAEAQAKQEDEWRVARESYAQIRAKFESAGLDIQKCGFEVFHHARRHGEFTHIKSRAQVQGYAMGFESAFKGESQEGQALDAFVSVFGAKGIERWCEDFIKHRTAKDSGPIGAAGSGTQAAKYEALTRRAGAVPQTQQGPASGPGALSEPG
jgi:hypothetical protein